VPEVVNIGNLVINGEMVEIDLAGRRVTDEEFMELQYFTKI
jgi:hypothetical protein